MAFDSLSDSSSFNETWISWYCKLEGNKFLAEIDEEFASDSFNYNGLNLFFANFDQAVSMMTGGSPSKAEFNDPDKRAIYKQAKDLYTLLHSRYIISPKGLSCMRDKYLRNCFGYCPRVLCDRARLLPVGLSDELGARRARVYCQKCQEVYNIREPIRALDGANFGSSFPHIFIQTFVDLISLDTPSPYVPKIFGFRIHNIKSLIQVKLEKGEYGDISLPSNSQFSDSDDGQHQSVSGSLKNDDSSVTETH